MLLRFDYSSLSCGLGPAAPASPWARSSSSPASDPRHQPQSYFQHGWTLPPPPPTYHLFPPPPLPFIRMEESGGSSQPFSDAAKALLSSPLPPELVVDFKGSGTSAPHLRNSTSESNVHELPAGGSPGDARRALDGASGAPACRTLSDGARKSYARRKLESEDSSYDSDYEASESPSLALTSPAGETGSLIQSLSAGSVGAESSSSSLQQHEDVSRTVSDTLAAEFSEYVCVHNPSFQRLKETGHDDSPDEEDDDEDEDEEDDDSDGEPPVTQSGGMACVTDPSYSSRVEFALKLGYTELQVQKALAKLGAQPAQNELLAELIRLASLPGAVSGAFTGSSGSISESGSDMSPGLGQYDLQLRAHRPLSATQSDESLLRHIVIDGSNVAISHGNKEVFSCRGIQICVDWFRARGHRKITVFVPMWRKESPRIDTPITNQEILLELEKERLLVFTPSRQVGGRRLVCYDDRYVLRLAAETDGVVVSNDNYRDLISENPEYRKIVEERILMYSFVNDRFMPPDDPLGRNGPKLDRFLRKPSSSGDASGLVPPCPYGKKCTYGNKCKYYHPERGNAPQKTITERLAEQAQRQLLEVKARSAAAAAGAPTRAKAALVREPVPTCKTMSLPLSSTAASPSAAKPPSPVKKTPLARTKSIVPTLSLLPPELTEERPVQDSSSSSSGPTDRPILKSRSVENMAKLTPAKAQQKHGPILQAPPPTFSVPPPMPPSALDWTRGGQQPVGSHLPLCQRLSDPPSAPADSLPQAVDDPTSYNPHRKVQRQLTLNPLNPNCDPRIYTLKGLVPPYPPPPLASAVHHHHSLVTRNASAPVPASQLSAVSSSHHSILPAGGSHHMQRLSSTSDTQLNLYGGALASSQDWIHDPFDEWTKSPPPPMAPPTQQHQPLHQHPWAGRTTSLPAHHHLSSSPVQQQKAQQSLFSESNSSLSGNSTAVTEARYKLFFHLAAIFPEDQVRAVMQLMPEETNAQKICAAILSLYPKED